MKSKKESRLRRAARGRAKIRELGMFRLCINRTPRHIYAQVIAPNGSEVVAAASTVQSDVKSGVKFTGNADAAVAVGKAIAEKARQPVLPRLLLTAPVLNTMVA
jgi:large subunit ribosomal protein L18